MQESECLQEIGCLQASEWLQAPECLPVLERRRKCAIIVMHC